MATRTRKTTLKNNSAAAIAKPAAKRRRAAKPAARRAPSGGNFANFFVPLFLIFCILFCLGFLGFIGYRTVTASEFFDVQKIDVDGATHASKSDIEKIVAANTEKSGVWNADLNEIKNKVERLDFVKSAAVSRVLPDGVRVNLIERVPKAVVRVSGGDFWADEEGVLIAPVAKANANFPFVIRGWDETKASDDAVRKNQQRVKLYQKMLEEWKTFELDKRVKIVDLTDLSEPKAIVEDSGESVEIILAKDKLPKLQTGLENIAGKGKQVAKIDVSDVQPKYTFRQTGENQN
ncbi:MAG TPA: FtsQ-type POTRA domain-containing protein [Pyrinomonadaceae bacterium]|jgi:cell division septal protein FtsQ